MTWLTIAIFAYFSLAVVSLFDRYLLAGKISNPKTYTFYVGVFWLFTALLILPLGVSLPLGAIGLGLLAGFARILAMLFLAESIVRSEISKAVPAIGAFLPIFSFIFFFFYQPGSGMLNFVSLAAFGMLLLGSVLISLNLAKGLGLKSIFSNLRFPILSAFFFALNFFLTKLLFIETNFINGFFWPLVAGGVVGSLLLIAPSVRKDIFVNKVSQKIPVIFVLGQLSGGLGVLLQYYAVFLAKPSEVPLVNALEGTRYIFLLFFVFILSIWNKNILKEDIKGSGAVQKILAVIFIGAGLALLTL